MVNESNMNLKVRKCKESSFVSDFSDVGMDPQFVPSN